jgi:hypothetical protein
VHLACLFGELIANIRCVRSQTLGHFGPCGGQCGPRRPICRLARQRAYLSGGAWIGRRGGGTRQVQSRGTQHFGDRRITTNRALNQSTAALREEVRFGGKPPFEKVVLRTLKVQDFHKRRGFGTALSLQQRQPVQFPITVQYILQPQGAGQRFGIGDLPMLAPQQQLLGCGGKHL